MPSTRAWAVVAVGLEMKPVGKPDAGNPHVRFDERGRETGQCATAPVLDSTCASTARIICGGRFHPESCRLIRKLTSSSAGQPVWLKPRDKGRLGRSSDPTGRNVSEVRAGLERVDADADPSFARGRPRGQGSNRHMHLFGLPGYWTQHVGRVMRVIEGDPSGSEVAASTPHTSGGIGRVSDRVIVLLKPGKAGEGKDPGFWCAFDDGEVG
jgi:hypothetical protein